jgi:hypothetical protein
MTPGFAKPRSELPWIPYEEQDRVIINSHNFGGSYDTDAAAYIAAVEAADGLTLGTKYKDAINAFVVGCKSDGIWTALKAACFLAGPATLAGALVPLVGTAPTNVGGFFVSGDHSQAAGLTGDGSTKYLDSNRTNNADPQDNFHLSVWVSTAAVSGTSTLLGSGNGATAGESNILCVVGSNLISFRNRNSSADSSSGAGSTGLIGSSRSASASYSTRVAGTTASRTRASQTPFSGNVFVFSRNAGASKTTARIAWYSIGEALDLALLDARLTTYMAAIA